VFFEMKFERVDVGDRSDGGWQTVPSSRSCHGKRPLSEVSPSLGMMRWPEVAERSLRRPSTVTTGTQSQLYTAVRTMQRIVGS
jgi:hypothetical protein